MVCIVLSWWITTGFCGVFLVQAVPPILTFLLHRFPAKHNKNCLTDRLGSIQYPNGEKSSYNLLAASVYFTAHLRMSLICFHHLLYSFKTCFIILNSRVTVNKQNLKFLFLRKSLCFHILALCHNTSKDGVQKTKPDFRWFWNISFDIFPLAHFLTPKVKCFGPAD